MARSWGGRVLMTTVAWLLVVVCLAVVGLHLLPDAVHHVIGGGTMAFMLVAAHGEAPASVAAILLAGYFAWHALRCGDRFRSAAAAAGAPVRVVSLRDARVAAAAHGVLAAAMAAMLLGMV